MKKLARKPPLPLLLGVEVLFKGLLRIKTREAITAALAFALSACGGGGGLPNGPVVNSPGSGSTPPPVHFVDVKVTVTVPPRSGERIRPGYVSVNTRSLVIALASVNGGGATGVNPTIINTLPHARGCKDEAGQTVCTATTTGSPGEDVFGVTTYASTNANGAVLSVGSVQTKIASGGGGVQISNKLSLSLEGAIASLQLSVSPNGAKRGKAATADVTLNAFDASGAQIVGPSDYAIPIQLAIDGDTRGAFALHGGGSSGSSLNIAKPTSNITLSYDGNGQASSVTLASSVEQDGSIGASANFALHGKQPPPPVGTIYALNLGTNDGQGATVTEYGGKASGNTAPQATLQLSAKLYARSIAVDASGQLYVGYYGNSEGFSPSNGAPDTGNQIAIYAKGASGNDQPAAVITADKTTQTAIFPAYLTFDASGGLVTYGATSVDGNGGNDAVLIYAPGANGAAAPKDGWAFTSPLLRYSGPTGVALDASGNFYVAGALHTPAGPSYGTFVAPASDYNNPSVNPSRTIPWDTDHTELNPTYTTNVVLDASGEILMGNTALVGSGSYPSCQGRANVFAAGSGGGSTDEKPLRTLTFTEVFTSNLQCLSPTNPLVPFFPSLALYGTTLFVANDFNNAIDAYPANAHGTIKASLQITGAATQLNAPIALVVTSVSGQAKARPARPLVTLHAR